MAHTRLNIQINSDEFEEVRVEFYNACSLVIPYNEDALAACKTAFNQSKISIRRIVKILNKAMIDSNFFSNELIELPDMVSTHQP